MITTNTAVTITTNDTRIAHLNGKTGTISDVWNKEYMTVVNSVKIVREGVKYSVLVDGEEYAVCDYEVK